jgi:hypothetical protein
VTVLVAVSAVLLASAAPASGKSRQADVLWYNANTGEVSAWEMNGAGTVLNSQPLSWRCDTASGCAGIWKIVGTADDNITWHNAASGELSVWHEDTNTGAVTWTHSLSWRCDAASGCASAWKVIAQLDVDRDWDKDLLWYNANTGELSAWLLDPDGSVTGTRSLSWRCDNASGCARTWKVVGAGDFSGDGRDDLLWHNATSGELSAWVLDGTGTALATLPLSRRCGGGMGRVTCSMLWRVVGTDDFNHDGQSDVVWFNRLTGEVNAWHLDNRGTVTGTKTFSWRCTAAYGCSADWQPVGVGNFAD